MDEALVGVYGEARDRDSTVHKLRNLQALARRRQVIAEDHRRMIYAESATVVEKARGSLPAALSGGRREPRGGGRLFTLLRFPVAQWKACQTINPLERHQRGVPVLG